MSRPGFDAGSSVRNNLAMCLLYAIVKKKKKDKIIDLIFLGFILWLHMKTLQMLTCWLQVPFPLVLRVQGWDELIVRWSISVPPRKWVWNHGIVSSSSFSVPPLPLSPAIMSTPLQQPRPLSLIRCLQGLHLTPFWTVLLSPSPTLPAPAS